MCPAAPAPGTSLPSAATSPTRSIFLAACATPSPMRATASRPPRGTWRALDLSVHAELATDYFTLRGLDVEQQLLDRTVADYAQALAADPESLSGRRGADLRRAAGAGAAGNRPYPGRGHAPAPGADRARHRRPGRARGLRLLDRPRAASEKMPPLPTSMRACPRSCSSDAPTSRPPSGASPRPMPTSASRGPPSSRSSVCSVPAARRARSTSNWISAPSEFWSLGPQAVLTLFAGGLHAGAVRRGARRLRRAGRQLPRHGAHRLTRTSRTTLPRCGSCSSKVSARRPPSRRRRARSIRRTCATRAAS